jgi:4-hydroxy-2-oxoheptanedioate aldolase
MSKFLENLRAGRAQWGLLASYPAPGMIERIGRDWDWVWIDAQHGQLGYQDILAHVRTCDYLGCAPFIRIASHEYAEIGRALDTNPAGVIVPMVQNRAEAERVVAAAKYPPLGNRSYGGRRVGDVRGRHYPREVNADVLLLVQIETTEAVADAANIAAVPGVDGLFYGPDDMFLRRGLPMDTPKNAETLGADLLAVAAACRKHRKVAVTLAFTPELIAHCVKANYGMLVVGSDILMLTAGSKEALAVARAQLPVSRNASPDLKPSPSPTIAFR